MRIARTHDFIMLFDAFLISATDTVHLADDRQIHHPAQLTKTCAVWMASILSDGTLHVSNNDPAYGLPTTRNRGKARTKKNPTSKYSPNAGDFPQTSLNYTINTTVTIMEEGLTARSKR